MSTVRRLIEQLDVIGEHHEFAQDADPFGDDLEQAWASIENGANLLWLAAGVGVDSKQIVAAAREVLESVFEQIEPTGQETAQVLEAVRAWERGERSADEVYRSSWDAYDLIAQMNPNDIPALAANEVADAAVWLAELVRDIPPRGHPDLRAGDDGDGDWGGYAWMMLNRLADARRYHQNCDERSSGKRQEAHDEAMRHFARTIREHITGAQVRAAAQQSAVWPLS